MSLQEIKYRLRDGKYAWPGGYPCFFVTSDGEALSFEAVRAEWRQVVAAHLHHDIGCGWHIAGCDINYEDADLYCAHTGKRIESAYADND